MKILYKFYLYIKNNNNKEFFQHNACIVITELINFIQKHKLNKMTLPYFFYIKLAKLSIPKVHH